MEQTKQFAHLQKQMRACRDCRKLGHYIEPPAVTQGLVTARIMTIGQAPGVTEVEAKRPFNAGSGTRLFQWLGEAGIAEEWFRSTQYMTSVTKCYPGKSANGSGDRVPTREEQEACRHFLDAELRLVDPELVIPIGRLAINLFFPRSRSLAKIIGTQIRAEGRWIVPLPHPSGASRWHQTTSNRRLIDKAIELICSHVENLQIL